MVLELIETDRNSPQHSAVVGKFLKRQGFNHFTEIEKLGKFRFKIATTEEQRLKRTKLDEGNLRIYERKNMNQTIAFIREVTLSFEEAEMLENIEADVPVLKVQRIKIRGRNKELLDTYNVKATDEGHQVPNRIHVYGCSFRAELCIFPIRQCKNCWRYGHGAKLCTPRTRCAACGGGHEVSVCDKDAKCPNCKRGHKADDPECRRIGLNCCRKKAKPTRSRDSAMIYKQLRATGHHSEIDPQAQPTGERKAENGKQGSPTKTNPAPHKRIATPGAASARKPP
ncbi:uncharacterized protein LOC110674277 [Aedes aegypti]|uniref:Uncharacterized protein n=1 Tax=Aedes aegypti TaxID=7159 RepID=A0A6I8TTF8_AEDAE|nr:uncharacterized protein LOC110674277 [Aedes aegypti]